MHGSLTGKTLAGQPSCRARVGGPLQTDADQFGWTWQIFRRFWPVLAGTDRPERLGVHQKVSELARRLLFPEAWGRTGDCCGIDSLYCLDRRAT